MKSERSYKAIAIAFVIILAVFGIIFLVFKRVNIPTKTEASAISLTKDGHTITVSMDGSVFEDGNLVETWDTEKTRAFFDYYNSQYTQYEGGEVSLVFSGSGGVSNSSVPGSDELTNIIFNDTGGGGGGGNNGGGGTSDFFNSPTPTPLPYGSPSPLPSSAPSWCTHWLLSYCADTPPPLPTFTPTPTPGPTPLPPDCNVEGNQQTGRTVISNELCIPTPTP